MLRSPGQRTYPMIVKLIDQATSCGRSRAWAHSYSCAPDTRTVGRQKNGEPSARRGGREVAWRSAKTERPEAAGRTGEFSCSPNRPGRVVQVPERTRAESYRRRTSAGRPVKPEHRRFRQALSQRHPAAGGRGRHPLRPHGGNGVRGGYARPSNSDSGSGLPQTGCGGTSLPKGRAGPD